MFELPLKRERRHILHLDADAFFASVEQVLDPTLKGKPVLVGGPSEKNGIVSAASYEAKKFGVHSGMALYLAKRKCPKGVVVNGKFAAYRDFSRRMYRVFLKYTPDVEMASIDEAYLDVTNCLKMHGVNERELARAILIDVNKTLGISISCGLASNKVVAKAASSLNKPHKLTVVPFGKEAEFLAPLPLRAVPGIGPRTCAVLERCGFKSVSEVAAMSFENVMEKFGVQGIPIWKKCRGYGGGRVISTSSLPKSISKERTFYSAVESDEACVMFLRQLAQRVFTKLRSYDMKARNVFVKIRYKRTEEEMAAIKGASKRRRMFESFVFQKPLALLGSADDQLLPVVKALFLENLDRRRQVRLIGVGVTNLVQNYNLSLFGNGDQSDKFFMTIDAVKDLYGSDSVKYGV